MTTRRFMIHSRTIRGGFASFDGELFNHIVRVLRLRPGDEVVLVDERGDEHSGVVDQVSKDWVAVKIVERRDADCEIDSAPRITLCQALPKGEKTDLILQKCTELGVHEFWLFSGKRSVPKMGGDQLPQRLERWNRITREAARQCGRKTAPAVRWFTSAEEVARESDHTLRILLWEGEHDTSLRNAVPESPRPSSAAVVIGPEGGFDIAEAMVFAEHGFSAVSLGKRILRTETAALAISAVLQYIWREI